MYKSAVDFVDIFKLKNIRMVGFQDVNLKYRGGKSVIIEFIKREAGNGNENLCDLKAVSGAAVIRCVWLLYTINKVRSCQLMWVETYRRMNIQKWCQVSSQWCASRIWIWVCPGLFVTKHCVSKAPPTPPLTHSRLYPIFYDPATICSIGWIKLPRWTVSHFNPINAANCCCVVEDW